MLLTLPGLLLAACSWAPAQTKLSAKHAQAAEHFRCGLALADRHDLPGAAQELLAATQLNPQQPRYQLALGMVYRQAGNQAEALHVFQRLLRLDPGQAEAARWAARITQDLGRDSEALSILEKAYARNPDWKVGLALAESYALAGRRPKALALLREILARHRDSAPAMQALGEILTGAPATRQEGGRFLRRAVEQDPESATARFALGHYLLQEGSAGEAVVHLQQAVRLRPQEGPFRYSLAQALLQAGQKEEGERHMAEFRRQVEEEDQRKNRRRKFQQAYQRGLEAVRGQDLVSARQALLEALAASPEASAYGLLAKVLYSMDRLPEAVAAVEEALRLAPGNGEYHYLRGLFRVRSKQWENALGDLRAAAALEPSLADAYNQQGNALAGLARWEEAAVAYRRAVESDPAEASYWLNLSVALKSAGRLRESDEAQAQYERRVKP